MDYCPPSFYLYLMLETQKCYMECPSEYYADTNLYCKLCSSNCLTCAIVDTNCTSCNPVSETILVNN